MRLSIGGQASGGDDVSRLKRTLSFTRLGRAIILLLIVSFWAGSVAAYDKFGNTEQVPRQQGAHWLWVYDTNFISFSDGRAWLVDVDNDRILGSLNTGYVHNTMDLPRHYREIYSAETYYSRHVSGDRTDLVRVYDPQTLSLKAEIPIPNKRATTIPRPSNTALTGDARFMLVFNLTPATSVSVVDLQKRKFIGEIDLPGCGGLYTLGTDRFLSLCNDGSVLVTTLDGDGQMADKTLVRDVFDAQVAPLVEYALKSQDRWYFVSMDNRIHTIRDTGALPEIETPWPLLSAADESERWRIGGMQQLAAHEGIGHLFTLMHQGEVDTYEHAGSEVWIYDLASKQRIRRMQLQRNTVSILVSPDDAPLLYALPENANELDIYDARTGAFLRTIPELGITPVLMEVPPGEGLQ